MGMGLLLAAYLILVSIAFAEPLNLCARYLGEDKGKAVGSDWFHVHYFSALEQAQHEVSADRGRAVWKMWNHRVEDGSYLFVFTVDRRFIVGRHYEYGKYHHSTLAAGKPVLAAGWVSFYKGIVSSITPQSGHYKPTRDHIEEAAQYFNSQGVFVRKVVSLPGWTTALMQAEDFSE